MAILKDFINEVDFDAVWELLKKSSEDYDTYHDSFLSIFNDLRNAVPAPNTNDMTIRFVEEDQPEWLFFFDDEAENEESNSTEAGAAESNLQVYGFIPGDEEGYAIGVKPPEILVGLNVDEETVTAYSAAEIVAYCLAEMTYTATVAASAYGTEKDTAGGGLLASQECMKEDIQNIDLQKLRETLGVIPKTEDYKEKYGFLF